MASKSTITACYSVSCMDPRERVVEARYSKLIHLVDAVENGSIDGQWATKIQEIRRAQGIHALELAINFYRNARAGGGWSIDARDDLKTIKENGLSVAAVYSTRHRQCAAISVDKHLYDQDIAVMIVQDFDAVDLELPPVFRAHLEVVSKHEEFDQKPMNLKALVAYALQYGTGQNFPADFYNVQTAAEILGISQLDKDQLKVLADTVELTPKGLLAPDVELNDVIG